MRISSNPRLVALLAATIAPALWGISWVGTTEFMPQDRPLLTAWLRALPTGLLLLAFARQLPRGVWWWRAGVLGMLNFGLFFALLTIAAYRVPGGIGAMMGALQPLMVIAIAMPLLGALPRAREVLAGLVGVAGVSLLVFSPGLSLDMLGIAAAVGSVASMSFGVVLMQRWRDPEVGPLALTAWQLIVAGLMLVPASLLVEGAPPAFTGTTVIGILFVGLLSTGVGNWLWFIGLAGLPAQRASFFALIAPIVATATGWIVLGEALTPLQMLGAAIAVASVIGAQWTPARWRPGQRSATTIDMPALQVRAPRPMQQHRQRSARWSRHASRRASDAATDHCS